MVRPNEDLAKMRIERNQFVYYRFTFSYQSFLFKQITISYEKRI